FIPAGEAFSPACFVMPFFSCANFAGLFSLQLLTFVCRTPRVERIFSGEAGNLITQFIQHERYWSF
ncbi:hypothetical protein, partial [Dysosmobacter sp.]|uniref:hypothetical protein n=1 Tax=Dysosmobacter sp. TaxID=2591382 RepID=UPI003AABA3BD